MPAPNSDTLCSICASRENRGTFSITRRGAGPGVPPDVMPLCTPCFSFLAEACRPTPDGAGSAGAPACGICLGPTASGSNRVELASVTAEGLAGPLRRLGGDAQVELCDACLAWTEALIEHESVSRWGRQRHAAEPRAGEVHTAVWDGLGAGLTAADRAMARDTFVSLGGSFDASAVRDRPVPGPGTVYLVQAGLAGEAAAFTQSLPARDRWRVVVVTEAACRDDAMAALRAGAGDFLASPLSRQQVAGALDRAGPSRGDAARDPDTGLPLYALQPRFGLSAHLLRISAGPGGATFDTALVLRRYLRGYDLVTAGDGDWAEAHVFCEGREVGAVVRRISRLLGPGYSVDVCGLAAPGLASAPALGPAPLKSAARHHFGGALGRAS